MISVAFASLLLTAALPDQTAAAREAYARCLKEFVRAGVDKKMDGPAFEAALASACRDKEALFKTTLISADTAMGIKRAASEKASLEQISDYRLMAKEDFQAELASAPKP